MKISDGFEMVNIAEEHIVIPVGEKTKTVNGLVVLNDAAAFLLEKMKNDMSIEELVALLMDQYDVDIDDAKKDISEMLKTLSSIGLLCD